MCIISNLQDVYRHPPVMYRVNHHHCHPQGRTIFYTEIKRTKNDEGREFVHIKALKKLTAAPVVNTPPAG